MRIKNIKFITGVIVLSGILSSNVMAGGAHTWHTVFTKEGTWKARLAMINEGGFFITRSGDPITGFTVSPSIPQDFGFGFDEGSDFDVAYTLTMTQDATTPSFSSKACVYIVSASGPAQPDVRIAAYNGAQCEWNQVRGKGIDFTVS